MGGLPIKAAHPAAILANKRSNTLPAGADFPGWHMSCPGCIRGLSSKFRVNLERTKGERQSPTCHLQTKIAEKDSST